jgi:hypothetical protein
MAAARGLIFCKKDIFDMALRVKTADTLGVQGKLPTAEVRLRNPG